MQYHCAIHHLLCLPKLSCNGGMHHQKSRAQYVCNKRCQNESTLAKVKTFLSCKIGVFKTKNTRKILVIEKFCDFRSFPSGTPVLVGLVIY